MNAGWVNFLSCDSQEDRGVNQRRRGSSFGSNDGQPRNRAYNAEQPVASDAAPTRLTPNVVCKKEGDGVCIRRLQLRSA